MEAETGGEWLVPLLRASTAFPRTSICLHSPLAFALRPSKVCMDVCIVLVGSFLVKYASLGCRSVSLNCVLL